MKDTQGLCLVYDGSASAVFNLRCVFGCCYMLAELACRSVGRFVECVGSSLFFISVYVSRAVAVA